MKLYIEKLKAIRKIKKFTIEELAGKMGIARMTLSAWENARRIPTESKIRILAKTLGVPVEEISDLQPEKPISEISLTGIGKSVKSLVSAGKEKYLQRQKHLVSDIASIIKELSDANIIVNAMISFLPSIFYIKDTTLNYVAASEEFLNNLSLKKNYDVIGKNDYDFFSQKEAKFNHEMDKRVLMIGKSILNKEEYIPGSRKTKWGIASKIPIFDSDGKIEGVLGHFTDITERKAAEELLQANQIELEKHHEELKKTHSEIKKMKEKYYTLYNLSPVGYLSFNEEGLIVEVNLVASAMLSNIRELLINQPLHKFILPEDKDIFYLYFKRLSETGVHQKFNIRLLKKDGCSFNAEMSISTVRYSDGKNIFMVTLN